MAGGPRFFKASGPVPVSMGGPRPLGALPPWDLSRPGTWPTEYNKLFAGRPYSGVLAPPAPGPAPQPQPFNKYYNFAIGINGNIPAITDDPARVFLLVQNLDPATTLLVSFGEPAVARTALQLLAGVGFVWDQDVPNNSMYVNSLGAVTVLPIGMAGSRVWLPPSA
jgi:hypothetical protein